MSTVAEIHDAALAYAARGLHVVPIQVGKKIPSIDEWQNRSSTNPEHIDNWWAMWPGANVGIQLGPRSGIIDVECDTAEAESLLRQAFGDDPPIVPTFVGKRGKHRLFQFVEGQFPDAAVCKLAGIEFRVGGSKGAQSLFPPSVHPDGPRYRWLVDLDEADATIFPQRAVDWLIAHTEEGESLKVDGRKTKKAKLREILKGVGEGGRNNSAAQLIGSYLADLADPCDNAAVGRLWQLVQSWNATNKPPMPPKELQTTFESILNRERAAAVERQHGNFLTMFSPLRLDMAVGIVDADGNDLPAGDNPPAKAPAASPDDVLPGWRLVIVQSKPRQYKLFSPRWQDFLVLTADDLRDWRSIGRKAIEQKDCWVEPWWEVHWIGRPSKGNQPAIAGLAPQLLAIAESEEAPPEQVRDQVIAELLHSKLMRTTKQPDESNGLPDAGGAPTRFPDDSYAFLFKTVWEDLARSDDRVTRGELSELLKRLDVREKTFTVKGSRSRWKILNSDSVKKLHDLLGLHD